jgi:hypothetical protein
MEKFAEKLGTPPNLFKTVKNRGCEGCELCEKTAEQVKFIGSQLDYFTI